MMFSILQRFDPAFAERLLAQFCYALIKADKGT
jgi:hypothetical protein